MILMKTINLTHYNSEQCSDCIIMNHGLLFAFCAGVLFTIFTSLIKFLDTMDPMQLLIIRGVIQSVMISVIMIVRRTPFCGGHDGKITFLIVINTIFGGTRMLLLFVSFRLRITQDPIIMNLKVILD